MGNLMVFIRALELFFLKTLKHTEEGELEERSLRIKEIKLKIKLKR